jgi:hypothetical protein
MYGPFSKKAKLTNGAGLIRELVPNEDLSTTTIQYTIIVVDVSFFITVAIIVPRLQGFFERHEPRTYLGHIFLKKHGAQHLIVDIL